METKNKNQKNENLSNTPIDYDNKFSPGENNNNDNSQANINNFHINDSTPNDEDTPRITYSFYNGRMIKGIDITPEERKFYERKRNVYDDLYEDESTPERKLEIYSTLADTLHYPTVLVAKDGTIAHKNKKAAEIRGKWRLSSNIKSYIGQKSLSDIQVIKIGDYSIREIDDEKVAILSFNDYFYIMFLTDFELNEKYIINLYSYITLLPEKNFFENRKLIPRDTMTHEELVRCDKFRKKFEHFYKYAPDCYRDLHEVCMKKSSEKEHDLVSDFRFIAETIQKKPYNFNCKFYAPKRIDFFVKCTTQDLMVLTSILLFLTLQCSSSKKPTIHINFERDTHPYSCRICFSTKSDMNEKEVKQCFERKEISSEMALYFRTAQNLAAKYFWGVGGCKNGDNIEISLYVVTVYPKRLWFHDSGCAYALEVERMLDEYIDILITDKYPDEIPWKIKNNN